MSRQKQRPFRCCSRQKHRDIMTAMIKNNDILTVDERLKLLKSLRWWHLGYGFIWSTVFVGASTTGTGSDLDSVYQVLQLLGCILAVIIIAFVSRHTFSSSPRCAWFAALPSLSERLHSIYQASFISKRRYLSSFSYWAESSSEAPRDTRIVSGSNSSFLKARARQASSFPSRASSPFSSVAFSEYFPLASRRFLP